MRLPRQRYTILSLMIVVLLVGLVLGFMVTRDKKKRIIAPQAAAAALVALTVAVCKLCFGQPRASHNKTNRLQQYGGQGPGRRRKQSLG